MEYKHFSHPHNLTLSNLPPGQHLSCHGCKSPCNDSSSIYACWSCSFFLHEHCGNASRYVTHPSHPKHPLILIPSPTYCSGAFLCNGCGKTGDSFSYCCALCEVDLHLNCAFLPPKITHKAHHDEHELVLNCSGECDGKKCCGVCREFMGGKNWFYFCPRPECDFQVHTGCGTTEVKPGLYQCGGGAEQSSAAETEKSEGKTEESAAAAAAPVADPVAELLQLQLQMQMAEQFAQMMASFNPSQFV